MRKERTKQAAIDGSDSTILNLRDDGGKLESGLTRETVEKLAYQYWLDRGCPEGSAGEDWLRAERTLLGTAATAGRLPDVQPTTAGAVMRAGS